MHTFRSTRVKKYLLLIVACGLSACTGIPEGLTPVQNFQVQRYLGTWYEIARLDHSFERGLQEVTAQYTLREGGGLRVINRGYDPARKEWREAEGKAYFIGARDVGRLKVSFFGPFYGAYNVLQTDAGHDEYALISGNTRSYLWILARQPRLEEARLQALVRFAREQGFATDELIYVEHGRVQHGRASKFLQNAKVSYNSPG